MGDVNIVGIVGVSCILLAFVLDEFYARFNQDTLIYNGLNIIGASLLMSHAYDLRSIPFFILNAVWFGVAGYKLILIVKRGNVKIV